MESFRALTLSFALILSGGLLVGCGGDDGPTEPSGDEGQTSQAPSASITQPSDGSTFALGENIQFEGQGDDPEDGTLTGSSLEWSSSIDGDLGTGTQLTHGNLWMGQHDVVLTVTDADGNTASDTVSVTIEETTGVEGTAYGVSSNSRDVGALQLIDLESGTVTRPGLLDDGDQYTVPVAMAARPSDDKLFLWNRRYPDKTLATVDRCTGRASTVALDVNVSGDVRGMAWGPDGDLYLLASKLHTVDPATGEVLSSVGRFDSIAGGGMTFDDQGRLLYGQNRYTGLELPLYEIDPSTGTRTLIDTLDANIGVRAMTRDAQGRIWATGMRYTNDGGQTSLPDVVYRIDPATADAHHIQGTDADIIQGLTFAPQPDCSGTSSPSVSITEPTDSAVVGTDTAVSFQGSGSDPEDGDLSGSSLAWESSLDGGLGSGTQTSDTLSAGSHEIRLIGTDSDGNADTASILVSAQTTASADTPSISSVTSPLPETQQATIDGSNFHSTPDSNAVSIGGVAASVSSADSTQLVITVPDLGCIPTGTSVEVTVTVGGKTSDPYGSTTEAEETAVSLSEGTQMIRTSPSNFCLQFPESSTSSAYLIGIQSLSSTAGSLTPIRIQSLVPGWNSSSSSSLDVSSSVRTDRRASTLDARTSYEADQTSGSEVPRKNELARLHREAELDLRRRERRELEVSGNLLPGTTTRDPRVSQQVTSPSVGDTLEIRVPDLASSNACDNYVAVTGVVKAMGTEGVIIADTAAPSGSEGGYTDQDYQDFSDGFDNRWPILQSYFGSPGDRDGNNRVVALFTPATTRGNSNRLGFVYSGDLLDRSTCASSSEGEIFYGRVPDANISYDYLTYLIPATIQHELTHVIQLSRHGDFLATHLSEGQANLAEEVSGHADTGRETYQNYGFDVALDSDQSDSVQWYPDNFYDVTDYFGFDGQNSRIAGAPEECGWWREDASPCTSRSLWYGVGWSFLRWVSDTYGPSYAGGEEQLHRDIIADSDYGIPKVAKLVGSDMSTLMARWAASLYLDDRVSGLQSGLTYSSWDLYNIIDQNLVETAHLKPVRADFSTWYWDADVRASSSGYLLVSGTSRPNTAISAMTQSGTTLPTDMQVWVVKIP